jgi:hypothetical protein
VIGGRVSGGQVLSRERTFPFFGGVRKWFEATYFSFCNALGGTMCFI